MKKGRVFLRAGWPKHVTKEFRKKLQHVGNGLRGLYGAPVYLVGSALLDSNMYPRDWDIRIMLSDAEFTRRYGNPQTWHAEQAHKNWTRISWRWSDDCVKQSKVESSILGVLVDFQVYPLSIYRKSFRHRPRLRLDTR